MIIYADILVAVNWWIDFLLLTGAARFAGVYARVWRVIIAALIGALFSTVLLLPALPIWLTLLLKLLSAIIMVFVAFGRCSKCRFIKLLVILFSFSAGLAGLCSALYFYIAPPNLYVFNGAVYYAVSPWLLLVLTLVCYGILTILDIISRRRAPQGKLYTLTVIHNNHSINVRCLYDSGNHLVEPFSNWPVLVVERTALADILSIPENGMDLPPNGIWRVIPFNSIGGDGMLPAFVPDFVMLSNKQIPPCYVAVCDRLGGGDYQGLIGTALGEYII